VIDVTGVRPGSPASAAGIAAGDKITAVNGRSASEFSSADLYDIVTAPAGNVVHLLVQHGTTSKDVDLTLRDVPAH
jgi:S1-C subfamily serine protease